MPAAAAPSPEATDGRLGNLSRCHRHILWGRIGAPVYRTGQWTKTGVWSIRIGAKQCQQIMVRLLVQGGAGGKPDQYQLVRNKDLLNDRTW